jgi:hypothetical protein
VDFHEIQKSAVVPDAPLRRRSPVGAGRITVRSGRIGGLLPSIARFRFAGAHREVWPAAQERLRRNIAGQS